MTVSNRHPDLTTAKEASTMLRTDQGGRAWFVTQPHHAEVAGYLAAHWGNAAFVRPGHFAAAPDPERLRAETVFGIAQHDNGWWEWDAAPDLAPADGLPLGLRDAIRNQEEGMRKWRVGVPRFAERHAYAALLISCHAYWLHGPRIGVGTDPAFRHPLHGRAGPPRLEGVEAEATRAFMDEIEALQTALRNRIGADPACASWLDGAQLDPHVRLLQLLDTLSLSLCAAVIPPLVGEAQGLGEDAFDLLDVPRRGWSDRVAVAVRPCGGRRIVLEPYPFDQDPLPVTVQARVLEAHPGDPALFATRWHGLLPEPIRFEYRTG
jgi:hypothetical protein